jgi:hypothetical protein
MTGELKKFEASIRVQMPGQSKENEYKIVVSANDRVDADIKVGEEWARITELRDVRIKEVAKVMTV